VARPWLRGLRVGRLVLRRGERARKGLPLPLHRLRLDRVRDRVGAYDRTCSLLPSGRPSKGPPLGDRCRTGRAVSASGPVLQASLGELVRRSVVSRRPKFCSAGRGGPGMSTSPGRPLPDTLRGSSEEQPRGGLQAELEIVLGEARNVGVFVADILEIPNRPHLHARATQSEVGLE
jgi:hypothetical protein